MSKRWIAPAALALAFIATACAQAARTTTPETAAPGSARDADSAGAAAVEKGAAPQAQPPLPAIPPISPRVIKNASIEVRVGEGDFQERFSQASLVAEQFGGFVTGSSTFESQGRISSGTVLLRIPGDRFQAALAALKALGTVTHEKQDGQDVTREFVDLEARLRHAKSQESFYLRLMDQAKTIEEMVRIQEQLANVQLRIEELEGQLQYLRDQTSLATISVRIFEPGTTTQPPRGLGKAWSEAIQAFQRVVGGLIVGLGWVAPFALLGVAGLAGWRVARRPKPKPAA